MTVINEGLTPIEIGTETETEILVLDTQILDANLIALLVRFRVEGVGVQELKSTVGPALRILEMIPIKVVHLNFQRKTQTLHLPLMMFKLNQVEKTLLGRSNIFQTSN
jgi:hypothetical protein